ncbi:MAG: LysM peptidoglycan-binding domain-containing protein [Halioglobus sp.]|nr:LysM peptidoglycan-binding domain-containing protein [Halioglobus sp.]
MRLRHAAFVIALFCASWAAEQARAQDWVYRVQPGDTLWNLCIQYTAVKGCWKELGVYNDIRDDRGIQPGTDIRIPVAWLLEIPLVGKVLNVQGAVTYQLQPGSNPLPLAAGQDIALGSLLVSREGSAAIQLGNHSQILLRPNSVLRIDTMSVGESAGQTSTLRLDSGEVEVEVKPESRSRFEVHTPSAIAAVRGTQYRVVSLREEDSTRGEVLAGLVAVEAGSRLDVPAGFGVKAKAGEPLGQPRKLLDPPRFTQARIDAPLPLTVRWDNDPQAVSWQVDVYAGGENGELLDSLRSNQPRLDLESLDEGCYRLVARAIDGEGFNGLEQELPLCVLPPPPVEEEPFDYRIVLPWLATLALILIL